jgi:hypothetical protein
MHKYLFGLLLFITIPCCHATTSGTDVMHQCSSVVRLMDDRNIEVTESDMVDASKCIGMTEGVMNTLRQWEYSSKDHHTTLADTSCLAEGVTIEQALRISYKYMQDHPDQLHAPGRGLMYLALTQAFPCKS